MGSGGNEGPKGELEPRLPDTAMVHLYRGELSRSDTWRSRLDTTTNWALTTTAAVISFGFASPDTSHVVFIVGIWMVLSFLIIEARRYRYYDLWIRRVRLLEDGYWAPLLRREPADSDAMRELATELDRPQIHLSLFSAISTRLNRAYGPILLVLMITWFVKLYTHPRDARDFGELSERARIGPLAGEFVMGFIFLLILVATYLLVASIFTRAPLGELRSRPRGRRAALWESFYRPYATLSPRRRRRQPAASPPAPPPPFSRTPPAH
jgi:uncharacterized membrane protein